MKNKKNVKLIQCIKIKKLRREKNKISFGIEKFIQLFLSYFRFFSIIFWINHFISNKISLLAGKIFIEIVTVLKIILLILAIFTNTYNNIYVFIVLCYFSIDTLFMLMEVVLTSHVKDSPISYGRSIILSFFNYVEINLLFSIFYLKFKCIKNIYCSLQSIYFSFVTSTTLGYGEFYPINNCGYIFVILQMLINLFLVITIFSYFMSNFMNKKRT